MVEVYCDNCKFRFTSKPGKPLPKKCPYCNSEGTFKRVKSAQDWIDEFKPEEGERE
jgi:predicted Zn-ribbon and HTH transcriptional regulator